MENQQSQTTTQSTQTNSDATTWELPEEAIGRLGRGIIADVAFSPDGESLAIATGLMRSATRDAGLSLGDRACLALAIREHSSVLTADRAWATLDLDIVVEVIW